MQHLILLLQIQVTPLSTTNDSILVTGNMLEQDMYVIKEEKSLHDRASSQAYSDEEKQDQIEENPKLAASLNLKRIYENNERTSIAKRMSSTYKGNQLDKIDLESELKTLSKCQTEKNPITIIDDLHFEDLSLVLENSLHPEIEQEAEDLLSLKSASQELLFENEDAIYRQIESIPNAGKSKTFKMAEEKNKDGEENNDPLLGSQNALSSSIGASLASMSLNISHIQNPKEFSILSPRQITNNYNFNFTTPSQESSNTVTPNAKQSQTQSSTANNFNKLHHLKLADLHSPDNSTSQEKGKQLKDKDLYQLSSEEKLTEKTEKGNFTQDIVLKNLQDLDEEDKLCLKSLHPSSLHKKLMHIDTHTPQPNQDICSHTHKPILWPKNNRNKNNNIQNILTMLDSAKKENQNLSLILSLKNEQLLLYTSKNKELLSLNTALNSKLSKNNSLTHAVSSSTNTTTPSSLSVATSPIPYAHVAIQTNNSLLSQHAFDHNSPAVAAITEPLFMKIQFLKDENIRFNEKISHLELQNIKLYGSMEKAIEDKANSQLEFEANQKFTAEANTRLEADLESVRIELEQYKGYLALAQKDLRESRVRVTQAEEEGKAILVENKKLYENYARINRDNEEKSAGKLTDGDYMIYQEMKEKLYNYEELSVHLANEVETQKHILKENKDKIFATIRNLEDYKSDGRKKSQKIKEVKKERDMLKIEILKLKQVYSEKCDNYREIRGKLHKKLKYKDEIINTLQKELQQKTMHIGGEISSSGSNKLNTHTPQQATHAYQPPSSTSKMGTSTNTPHYKDTDTHKDEKINYLKPGLTNINPTLPHQNSLNHLKRPLPHHYVDQDDSQTNNIDNLFNIIKSTNQNMHLSQVSSFFLFIPFSFIN
jgi:hypothetical protein